MQYGSTAPVYQDVKRRGDDDTIGTVTPAMPDRPARVQVVQARKLQQAEHTGDYNIWYGKYMGENSFEKASRASTRVCLEADAGLTRADYTSNTAYICLHFARGCCVYGKDCTYRHCAPTEDDESMADSPHDIFGRDRHGSFRDDMGGVGTWNKECKTIYVGRMCAKPPEEAMTESVVRHFGEFGIIESCRVLKSKGCGFVTYKLRAAAEFAKEAMAEQVMDHDEQINVRWAYDDPNPRAQAVRLRNAAQQMLAAMEAKGHLPSSAAAYPDELPAEEEEEEGGSEPGAKRARGTPMTREEHEALQAAEDAAAEAEARAAAEEAEEAEREQAAIRAASMASRLDAILNGIPDSGGTSSASSASGGGAAAAASFSTPATAPAGAAADPMASFLAELAPETAVAPASLDATTELPPGVYQKKLPPGWAEYASPEGYPYYVGPDGNSTWTRPTQ